MFRSHNVESSKQSALAIVRSNTAYSFYETIVERKVGPDGGNSLTSVINCSVAPFVLHVNDTSKLFEEALTSILKTHVVIRKKRPNLYLLSGEQIDLLLGKVRMIVGDITDAEIKLIDSYIVKYNNDLCQMLIRQLESVEFWAKVDIAVDVCIDRELARFFGSTESDFEAIREKIKATAITVTETATESSATLGIESAAQALGQAAIGVGITVMVDLALTSHSLYKAKKAKDMGLIDEKQFETKIKKKVCESGCQFIGGTTGSVVGQLVIPIPVVGAFVGGLCGSLIGTGIGKGVNYGLFERKESNGNQGGNVAVESNLIASVFDSIKGRNPVSMITYIEKGRIFKEIYFNDKSNRNTSSNGEKKSSLPIRYLFEKKVHKEKLLIQSIEKDNAGSEKQGWKRRYSYSVGMLKHNVIACDTGKNLHRENSLSTSCLDRCCEELTTDNGDNGKDPKVIAITYGNKSAGQISTTDGRETKIMHKESVRTDDSYAGKTLIKTLKSLDVIIKRKEKSCAYKQNDNEESQRKHEEVVTEDFESNSSTSIDSGGFRKEEDSAIQEKSALSIQTERDNNVPIVGEAVEENGDPKKEKGRHTEQEDDRRNIFKGAAFKKIASIWKNKAKPFETNGKAVLHNDAMRRLFHIIHKEGRDREEESSSEVKGEKMGDSLMGVRQDYPNSDNTLYSGNFSVLDDNSEDMTFFLTSHTAYGAKIRELVQNDNDMNESNEQSEDPNVSDINPVYVTMASINKETIATTSDFLEPTRNWTQPRNENEDGDEEHLHNNEKADGNRISTLAKDFISKLKRNLTQKSQTQRNQMQRNQTHSNQMQRNQKREEYTRSQENVYKTEMQKNDMIGL